MYGCMYVCTYVCMYVMSCTYRSQWSGVERGRVLHRAAALLRERNDDLALIEVGR